MTRECICQKKGRATQLFRIKNPQSQFELKKDFGELIAEYIAARQCWLCKNCGAKFAYMKIAFDRDEEEVLVS